MGCSPHIVASSCYSIASVLLVEAHLLTISLGRVDNRAPLPHQHKCHENFNLAFLQKDNKCNPNRQIYTRSSYRTCFPGRVVSSFHNRAVSCLPAPGRVLEETFDKWIHPTLQVYSRRGLLATERCYLNRN